MSDLTNHTCRQCGQMITQSEVSLEEPNGTFVCQRCMEGWARLKQMIHEYAESQVNAPDAADQIRVLSMFLKRSLDGVNQNDHAPEIVQGSVFEPFRWPQ